MYWLHLAQDSLVGMLLDVIFCQELEVSELAEERRKTVRHDAMIHTVRDWITGCLRKVVFLQRFTPPCRT